MFLFSYERDFIASLSYSKETEVIQAFISRSRYLDDLFNIYSPNFEGMVGRIYPPDLHFNKANASNTEAPFSDLHLSISDGFVSSKIYIKRGELDFDSEFSLFGGREAFFVLPLTVFTLLNLSDLLECLVM